MKDLFSRVGMKFLMHIADSKELTSEILAPGQETELIWTFAIFSQHVNEKPAAGDDKSVTNM